MELPTTGQEAIGHDESPVHTWRVSQLERLGVPRPLAEIYADRDGYGAIVLASATEWPARPASTGLRSPTGRGCRRRCRPAS
jgi:hypothetical protein